MIFQVQKCCPSLNMQSKNNNAETKSKACGTKSLALVDEIQGMELDMNKVGLHA